MVATEAVANSNKTSMVVKKWFLVFFHGNPSQRLCQIDADQALYIRFLNIPQYVDKLFELMMISIYPDEEDVSASDIRLLAVVGGRPDPSALMPMGDDANVAANQNNRKNSYLNQS